MSARPSLAARLGAEPKQQHARRYAEVAVNASHPSLQAFSYAIPDGLPIAAGSAVYVPFGNQTLQGMVIEVHDTPVFSEPEKIREIRSAIGDGPLIDSDRIDAARWIAHEYIAPIFESVGLFLPPGFERRPQTYIEPLIARSDLDALALPERLRDTMQHIIDTAPVSLDDLREAMHGNSVESAVAALDRRGLVARSYSLARPSVAEKTEPIASLAVAADHALRLIAENEPPKRSRRAAVLERLMTAGTMPLAEATHVGGTRGNLDRMVRAHMVRIEGGSVCLELLPGDAEDEIAALTSTRRAREAITVVRALDQRHENTLLQLRDDLGVRTNTVRWLASIGAVAIEDRHVERDPLSDTPVARRPPPTLMRAQQSAADTIGAAIRTPRHETFLLHGVTGSGKTEVYLDALDRCIAVGRRAIVLVPEIALTPQTIRRFRERAEHVAVIHSGLSDGERYDQWYGIAAGKYDVVIGARSAVFAPQPDLGLIVVDEEHEWTYKQHDPVPRYHSRDVAIELARRKSAAVILGSATPDVCSYHNAAPSSPAVRPAYTLLTLEDRVRPSTHPTSNIQHPTSAPAPTPALPETTVIDLREELHAGNRSMFSRDVQNAVRDALTKDEQVILFLNRRGMAGHVQCRDCGFVPLCGSCDTVLAWHRQYDRLVCHQCNKRWRLPAKCKQCESPRIKLLGVGVEKVESEASRLFPKARLLRWDRDVTRTRGAHDRILNTFMRREADILIGTQMLAKGLDLPGVTVVGIVNADTALHLPDFRAGERTFQLITQVAGRAGRGERPGRVIIQTYTPDNYAIDAASRYDYEGFAATELEFRRTAGYPPFGRLVRLTLSHTNERWAREEASRVARALQQRRAEQSSDTDILGPSPSYIPRLRGRWRWQLILRGHDPASLVRDFVLPPHWSIDVDPASLT